MSSIKEVGEKIKKLRLKQGLKQKDLAKLLGITPQAISGWERGVTYPQVELYDAISKILDISKNVLFFDEVDKNEDRELSVRVIEVPFFSEVQVAAGNGSLNDDFSSATEFYPLPYELFKYRNIKELVCVYCCGDSMEPVITNGSILAVDLSENTICDGKIYLVNIHGLLRVKILFVEARGIVIKSYNNQYPDERIEFDELDDLTFKILGKVIWHSSVM